MVCLRYVAKHKKLPHITRLPRLITRSHRPNLFFRKLSLLYLHEVSMLGYR